MSGMDALYADLDAEWRKAREAKKAARLARGWNLVGSPDCVRGHKRGTRKEVNGNWTELIADLLAHRDEAGYAYVAAKRWGYKVATIRQRLFRDGIGRNDFGKIFKLGELVACVTRTVEMPKPEEGKAPGWRCAVNGKACELARTCVLGGREGCRVKVLGMNVMGFCVHAIGEDFNGPESCPHSARCSEGWRCWRRENVSELMLCGMWDTERDVDRRASAMNVTE